MSAARKKKAAPAIGQPSPAPWAVTGPRDEKGNLFVSDDAGRFVAKVHFRNPDPDGVLASEANARLIAAAPDLLKALQSLVLDADSDSWTEDDSTHRNVMVSSVEAARAVIAKARGQS